MSQPDRCLPYLAGTWQRQQPRGLRGG
jgi:hypothetical protein